MSSVSAPTATDPLPALKAVADASRLRLLRLLDLEELTVGELVRCTGLRQSSVSRHLRSLREAGLVEERSEGVRTYARFAPPPTPALRPLCEAVLSLVRDDGFGFRDDILRLEGVRRDREMTREELFDRLAEDWDAIRTQLLGGHLSAAEVTSLLLPSGMRIVDAGAGTGVYLPWLADAAGPDGRVIAVEHSAEMVKRARNRAATLPNVEVRRGRIEELPVDDGWADALILSLTLGHMEDPVAALRRCVRAVKPGGRVVVADVESHGDRTLVDRLGPGFAGFTPDRLVAMLREAGLKHVRRVGIPSASGDAQGNGNGVRRTHARKITPLRPLLAVGVAPE